MTPAHIALASTLLKDFVLPWVAKKKEVPVKTAKRKKGAKAIAQEVKEEYEFSPKRTAINALMGAALLFAVDAGVISTGTSECLQDAAQEIQAAQ